jgi:hypothetical protein
MEEAVKNWLERYAPQRQEPEDITLAMACAEWNVGRTMAARMLSEIPELTRVEDVLLLNGKRGSVWRPVDTRSKRIVTASPERQK